MRAALLVCLVLATGCTAQGPLAPASSPSSTASSHPAALTTGGIVEYAVPAPSSLPADCFTPCASSLGDVALGPDGNIWFVDVSRSQVGRITPDGKIMQFLAPSPTGGARTIAAGPDGYVWFTAHGGQGETDWIVRVTPNGALTKFPAGSDQHTAPESITAGPDGNVWFTEVFADRIGRMTPSGGLTEFPAPGYPRGIATGSDGALWFTTGSAVGRITVQGQLTLYPIGNDPSLPLGDIALGPDGNLWFTESGAIRHISPDGRQIVNVPLPQGSQPGSLAKGPDGNIWFTDSGLNAIVRMSVAGAIRQFPTPGRGAFPHGIAVGADGRIWFAEANIGRIASIGAKVPEASFSQGVALSQRVMLFADASPKTITVTNTGDAPLAIGSVKVTGVDSSAFATANDTCSGRSIAPGGTCNVAVTHVSDGAPGVVQSAFLEFPDNGTGSPQKLSLVAQLRPCKLPIVVSVSNQPAQGELLDTTTGRALNEPGGGFSTTASPARVNTTAQPLLVGVSSGYFDGQAGRWLPVQSAAWISPDGLRYAYIGFDLSERRELHVVDIATGRDRPLQLLQGFWWLVAFTDQGLYVNEQYEGVGPGLWLVDPETGAMRQVLADGAVYAVSGSAAWTAVWNSADKLPQPPGIGGGHNEIDRRDLATGARTTWLYAPGTNDYVVAVVGGAPVIGTWDGVSTKLVLASSPGEAVPMTFPLSTDQYPNYSGIIADPQGIWVGSSEGVYLWTARTGGILVSDEPGTPAGSCA